jgi:hypothetical protein
LNKKKKALYEQREIAHQEYLKNMRMYEAAVQVLQKNTTI